MSNDQEQSARSAAKNLRQVAGRLADSHQSIHLPTVRDSPLHARLNHQEEELRAAHHAFRQASSQTLTLPYAAEWMLDNFYVVQQALRQVEDDLPLSYYRRLPKLTEGDLADYPRIYAVARQIITLDQCNIDLQRVRRFLESYQAVQPLKMGELWALPIMLRFTLLESLTQSVGRLTDADETAVPPAAFTFDYDLADSDLVANCIPGLRTLGTTDWRDFVEEISQVEQTLRRDPAAIYAQMDFETRDRYRKVVEEIARNASVDEVDVARRAVELAQAHLPASAQSNGAGADPWLGLTLPRTAHIGAYLVDDGRSQLESHFNYHPPLSERIHRWELAHPTVAYLGSISAISLLLIIIFVNYALQNGGGPGQALAAGLLTLIPAVTIVVSLINRVVTTTIPPHTLPKLNFEDGLPDNCQTMVVIPALLSNEEEVRSLVTQLELHYLRNPDPNLTFALLGDFGDAPQEQMAGDDALVASASAGIKALNGRHAGRPFYLLHRRRLWNEREGVWMGWERKRGKLHEFNRLVRGDDQTNYTIQIGQLDRLPNVRYVITLDADTVLPREGGQRLVAALAHPLNQARFDPETGQIVAGYTVLQPRADITPASANQSIFTRVFAGDTGLDLYTRAVSDVYQDLFGEGIFVGKGIYDVDAFERSLDGRVPENALLSHDLFEGIHGRAALVTDIILYEEFPPHYLVHIRRSHRWIRGDWQLLPWLWSRVPHAERRSVSTPLSVIDRWKILDNLRRSLLPVALFALFLAGWLWLPGNPAVWTLLGIFTPAVGFVTTAVSSLAGLLQGDDWSQAARPLRDSAIRWLLALAFLPYEALLILDAVFITLYRLFISRRRMLQWTTAAHTVRIFGDEPNPALTWRQMISTLGIALPLLVTVILVNPAALLAALPLLVTWLLSSEIAYWISLPLQRHEELLTPAQERRLHRLARRTWLFYEQFVGPNDHWLPPDHFQESPRGVVAHRTSPTNVGLLLLSTLAAYDLGYVDKLDLALRLRSTFETLGKLDRYRGHFLNWIDTRTLEPLTPRYVSAVDSGNLAGCLLALKQACQAMRDAPTWRWARWEGLLDTLDVLAEALDKADRPQLTSTEAFQIHLADMRHRILAVRGNPSAWAPLLARFVEHEWVELDRHLVQLVEDNIEVMDAEELGTLRLFAERARHHLQGMYRHLEHMLPWLLPMSRAPVYFDQVAEDTAVAHAWQSVRDALRVSPALGQLDDACHTGIARLHALIELLTGDDLVVDDARQWCLNLIQKLEDVDLRAKSLLIGYDAMAQEAERYVQEMDFNFLYNKRRQVFHIGYNMETGQLDNSYYDLLASESRIASIVAIAKNDVPQSHWLHLGRPLTRPDDEQVLLSWSGTMFEYLMPPLLMRSYEDTLLHQSIHAAVDTQIDYGRQRDVPWGISESGFYTFDPAMNYQYRAFGVPSLGFKRGLASDLVIAPYASLMALPLRPAAVLENMDALNEAGMFGRYGYYEAIDYTESRLSLGQRAAIVRSYMAHHQGMIMLGLVNYLHDEPMVHRFHAEPRIQSVELLLQERIPHQPPVDYASQEETPTSGAAPATINTSPWPVPVETPVPLVHYLSNGRYSVLIDSAGAGYSRWGELALTRWRADTTLDDWGQWLYVHDDESGALWSAGFQPTAVYPQQAEVRFHPHKVEFQRRDHDISLLMEVAVAPDDDVEIRRVTLTNDSDRPRRLTLTSYGEVVLAPPETDRRHQAFVKLFVESRYLVPRNALLFRRRPRAADEDPTFLVHQLVVEEGVTPDQSCESDRAQFLGRNRTARRPQALDGGRLNGTTGATLDPIFALGQSVELPPRSSARLAFVTLAANRQKVALDLSRRYRRWQTIDRAFTQAAARSERELRQLGLETPELTAVQQLLSLLIYPNRLRRAPRATLQSNTQGQPALWAYGISGDYPILLVDVEEEDELVLLHELLQAHTYWRNRELMIDLVILNQEEANYGQELQGRLFRLVNRSGGENWINRRGGIFLLQRDQMSSDDRTLLHTAAHVVFNADAGPLIEQLDGILERPVRLPILASTLSPDAAAPTAPLQRPSDLQFDNGYGGFSPDGREYVIYLEPGRHTPAPWINVIANAEFGCLVSETGGGYSWAINSGENRLSPWRNDPVSDMPGEALYLRDEETTEVWSPTPEPAPADAPYLVRHGAGYTIFEHHSHGLRQETRLYVPPDDPVKIIQLRLENQEQRPRRLTVTYYVPWVLGTHRDDTGPTIIPEYDEGCHALLAANPYNVEFGRRVAFLAANKTSHSLTADRTEFLGRMGNLRRPAGLSRIGFEGRVEPGMDPCAVLQLHVDLPAGGEETVTFLLGQGADRAHTLELIVRYKEDGRLAEAWSATRSHWREILGAVQVETPDPAMDLLLNQWLLYQALSCRIWGRSALYQSSGAYGFRDQLQDVMSLLFTRPDLTREQILRAARHQFEAGDVLHWWHPPSGRGVRTRIKDDLLWLPYVAAHYVKGTGDTAVLDEQVSFLKGQPLEKDEEERYGHYETTEETVSLFEHCRRVLDFGATEGQHGLPLMGAGDWNDGMNRVGIHGRGESVWLAWFLHATLTEFADICEAVGRGELAETYRAQAEAYRQAIEAEAWDGDWYRRAYYDDGAPLGSIENEECQIDAIAQSWGVLSGAADPKRAAQAMASVKERLIDWDDRLIRLFTPPFDKTPRDPGYIKGYLPGIRENGGQYTHAAMWTIWALAEMGQAELAEKLYHLVNPIYRADTAEKAEIYKVEPYVVAADVYGVAPHEGRGGWTWYTGSSGWMYRLGLEGILGLRRAGDRLYLDPRIPPSWPGYALTIQHGGATYRIEVTNPDNVCQGVASVEVDGEPAADGMIRLEDDGRSHTVRVTLG